jgi:serine/threonine protein kinase
MNTEQDVVAVKTKKPIRNRKLVEIANNLFKSEIEVLCQLKHPNIVKFIGSQFNGAEPRSIVMEYIKGDSLDMIIKEKEQINESLIKVYTFQVLNAIVFMHSRNVMHRFDFIFNWKLTKKCNLILIKHNSLLFQRHKKFQYHDRAELHSQNH